jgi:hypothetical protein
MSKSKSESWEGLVVSSRRQQARARRVLHRHRRWWWLVGWAFPNLAHRHHLVGQADRARHADLPWYGLGPELTAARHLGGMSGFVGSDHVMHAGQVSVGHKSAGGASLHVTVQRHGGYPEVSPMARLALPLVRDRDGFSDPRWTAHTVEEFHRAQEQALAELAPQPLDVRVDGVTCTGEMVSVGPDWAAFVPVADADFDLELRGHAWPLDGLVLQVIDDLEPYIAGTRDQVGPLLLPRRPRLPRRAG